MEPTPNGISTSLQSDGTDAGPDVQLHDGPIPGPSNATGEGNQPPPAQEGSQDPPGPAITPTTSSDNTSLSSQSFHSILTDNSFQDSIDISLLVECLSTPFDIDWNKVQDFQTPIDKSVVKLSNVSLIPPQISLLSKGSFRKFNDSQKRKFVS